MNFLKLMKEEENEEEKEKENDDRRKDIELGFLMMDKMLGNENFVNMTNEIAKNMNIQELMNNISNLPEFQKGNCTPEEIEQFRDKDNKLDVESLYKYKLGKFGFSKNDQDLYSKNFFNLVKNPNFNKIIIQNDKKGNDNNI